jgi:hypothetical protein
MDDAHTAARDRPKVVSYRKVRVFVEKGPDAGRECFIVNQTLRVGSSSDNDLVLSDRFVSRRHCAIEPVSDGLRLRDEGARNAVLLNGIRIRDATVSGAVRLSLGDTVLLVEPQDAREEREQAVENRFGDLLGQSTRMRELFVDLARIAKSNVTLLIEGETGTGKELVAESVHAHSPRASGPFVVFDCGAVAPQLAEDALFGPPPIETSKPRWRAATSAKTCISASRRTCACRRSAIAWTTCRCSSVTSCLGKNHRASCATFQRTSGPCSTPITGPETCAS